MLSRTVLSVFENRSQEQFSKTETKHGLRFLVLVFCNAMKVFFNAMKGKDFTCPSTIDKYFFGSVNLSELLSATCINKPLFVLQKRLLRLCCKNILRFLVLVFFHALKVFCHAMKGKGFSCPGTIYKYFFGSVNFSEFLNATCINKPSFVLLKRGYCKTQYDDNILATFIYQ